MLQYFLTAWELLAKDQSVLCLSRRVQDPSSTRTKANVFTKTSTMGQRSERTDRVRNKIDVGEGISKVSHSENSKNKESVSGGVQSTRDNLVRTNKVVRNINFHYLRYSPSTSSVSISSATANSNTKEECILHCHCVIKCYCQRETCMVDKNLKLSNGWAIIQPPLQILMHTDASKKGWVQCVKEYKLGACGQRRNRSSI